jgi:hypothetical protein
VTRQYPDHFVIVHLHAREASAAERLRSSRVTGHESGNAFTRWDEKAGLQRDAIRSQCSTCSRHKEKETGDAEE